MTEKILYGVCGVCILLCLACCLGTMLYYRRELRRFSRALQTYEQTGFLGDEDCKEEMESKLLSQLFRVLRRSSLERENKEEMESKLLSQLFRVLRRSSLEREKAGKEKGEIASLLSDLSHQLKTPLANILLNTEILKAEKMQWLMKNLVKASRLEQGILTFESRPAPLGETIAKSINGVYAQAREKEIELEAGPFTECFPVHNPKWTAEAMGNILENAVKYSPAGSTVKIEVRPLEMYVQVNIRDQGPGIPERTGRRHRSGTVSGPAYPAKRERLYYGVFQGRAGKLFFPVSFEKSGVLTKLSGKKTADVRELSGVSYTI